MRRTSRPRLRPPTSWDPRVVRDGSELRMTRRKQEDDAWEVRRHYCVTLFVSTRFMSRVTACRNAEAHTRRLRRA
eukprot:1453058-Rhodomonas_salina.3